MIIVEQLFASRMRSAGSSSTSASISPLTSASNILISSVVSSHGNGTISIPYSRSCERGRSASESVAS